MPVPAELEHHLAKLKKHLYEIWHTVSPSQKLPEQFAELSVLENPYQLNETQYRNFTVVINSLLALLENLFDGKKLAEQSGTEIIIVDFRDSSGTIHMKRGVYIHMHNHIYDGEKVATRTLIPPGIPRANALCKRLIESFIEGFERVKATGNVIKFISYLGDEACIDAMTNRALNYGLSPDHATEEFSVIVGEKLTEKFQQKCPNEEPSYYKLLAVFLAQFYNTSYKADFGFNTLRRKPGAFDDFELRETDLYNDIATALRNVHGVTPSNDFLIATKLLPLSYQALFLELVFRGDVTLLPTEEGRKQNLMALQEILNIMSPTEQIIFNGLMTQQHRDNYAFPITAWTDPKNILALAVKVWKLPETIVVTMLQKTSNDSLMPCLIAARVVWSPGMIKEIVQRLKPQELLEVLAKTDYLHQIVSDDEFDAFKVLLKEIKMKLTLDQLLNLVKESKVLQIVRLEGSRFATVMNILIQQIPAIGKIFDENTICRLEKEVKSPLDAQKCLQCLTAMHGLNHEDPLPKIFDALPQKHRSLYVSLALRSENETILRIDNAAQQSTFDHLMRGNTANNINLGI